MKQNTKYLIGGIAALGVGLLILKPAPSGVDGWGGSGGGGGSSDDEERPEDYKKSIDTAPTTKSSTTKSSTTKSSTTKSAFSSYVDLYSNSSTGFKRYTSSGYTKEGKIDVMWRETPTGTPGKTLITVEREIPTYKKVPIGSVTDRTGAVVRTHKIKKPGGGYY